MDLFKLLLNLAIFFPLLPALVILFVIPEDEKQLIRRVALFSSFVPLAMVLLLWFNFDRTNPGIQFETMTQWFPMIGAGYHVGVDGISLSMLLLTVILTPLGILTSFNIDERVKMYMVLFLIMETASLGLFASLDLMIFFIFWEFGLVPMYFLIRLWGGQDRSYASFKFFIYTMAGSLGLLLSIQIIGLSMGTFDIPQLTQMWPALPSSQLLSIGVSVGFLKSIAYWAFFIAFAIKVPIWPFHTWLPDAHTQAPTAGSMMLAGVLLKLGAYGFLRLVIPFFPEQATQSAYILAALGMISIVLGGFAAFGQWDFKRLVAYSSINHMGFVVLGLAVYAYVYGNIYGNGTPYNELVNSGYITDAIMATNGVVLQMFNHGLSAAGMFFMVGVIYERTHTRDLKRFGGIWSVLPVFGGILVFISMASLGLPGLNGFPGEFAITRSAWGIYPVFVALSMIGLLMTGAYVLKGIGATLHGPVKPEWRNLPAMTMREHFVIWPLMLLILSLGVWPQWLLAVINDTVTRIFR